MNNYKPKKFVEEACFSENQLYPILCFFIGRNRIKLILRKNYFLVYNWFTRSKLRSRLRLRGLVVAIIHIAHSDRNICVCIESLSLISRMLLFCTVNRHSNFIGRMKHWMISWKEFKIWCNIWQCNTSTSWRQITLLGLLALLVFFHYLPIRVKSFSEFNS